MHVERSRTFLENTIALYIGSSWKWQSSSNQLHIACMKPDAAVGDERYRWANIYAIYLMLIQ
ncbi:MAG TPA: hypothetical protein PKV73_13085 [Agriterribacter sp.]|nr:hypothetical protein [Agriterribacter sp.]